MKYVTLYVEVFTAEGADEDRIRSAIVNTLDGVPLKDLGRVVGQIVHVQVTEGPKDTRQGADV